MKGERVEMGFSPEVNLFECNYVGTLISFLDERAIYTHLGVTKNVRLYVSL